MATNLFKMSYGVPCRIIGVWGITILLTFLLMGIWYIFQPSFVYTIIVINSAIEGTGINSTNTENLVSLCTLAVNITIPIMILGLWLWAIASSMKREWRGEAYLG